MRQDRLAWTAVVFCGLAHLALGVWSWRGAGPETYVLTPYVEVVPGAAPLDSDSAQRLRRELAGPVDARNIKHGYAWIGSTLSLQDLVSGITSLESAGLRLSAAQAARIKERIAQTRAAHEQMLKVQDEILRGEAALDAALAATRTALPAEQRARVDALLEHRRAGGAAPAPARGRPGRPSGRRP